MRMHDRLTEYDRMLMLRWNVMRLLLLMMVMGEVVVPSSLRRHAHRRRGPPLCKLSLEACCLTRFTLISTLFPHVLRESPQTGQCALDGRETEKGRASAKISRSREKFPRKR
ncbi:hypothetical protein X777_14795 [Ooceraea biroi]|uniref:Uncharacterized protein n=1 Tax=Ooceraea biroi TaxID=2015173 RepID=A0A026WSL1_OOCBI|nr:hypothetical protein X777_14795 [Ooceraea biroi]